MRDPYDVLGLGRSASEAEVKRAYRKLAKENHPDRHPGDAKRQAKFTEVSSAYEILGDKETRAKFDRGEIDAEGKPRFQGFAGGPGGQAGFENIDPRAFADMFSGFSRGGARSFRFSTGGAGAGAGAGADHGVEDDILRSVLGGMAGGRARPQRSAAGADVRAEVAVTLEDIASGKRVNVTLPTGKTVALTLPKGVADGQVTRLPGQGRPSASGGKPGDALVTIRLVPHPLFKAEGADLRLDLPVSLDEAVLGAKIAVPTLSGKVHVTIPPGSDTGRTLRLKGKGLPGAKGQGDLLVTPRIMLPEAADAELAELMRRWRDENRSSPRGAAFD